MAALKQNAYYRENQVTTASRGQLLLMVYDGLLRFLAEAKQAMSEQKYEQQNTNIAKAQNLLLELLCTLDHDIQPELANNLDRLYRYMYDRLTWANVHDEEQTITEVARLISELRSAWAEADLLARHNEGFRLVGGAV